MTSKAHKLSFTSDLGNDVVKILVGKKRKEYTVHKKLICGASKFFKDAFIGPFKESEEGTMYMPEDEPEIFSYFVQWLYRQPLPYIELPDPVDKGKGGEKECGPATKAEHEAQVAKAAADREVQDDLWRTQLGPFLRLYYFAEKIFADGLKNRTMDRIRQGCKKYDKFFTCSEIRDIYLNTTPKSQLRAFCIKATVFSLISSCSHIREQLASLMVDPVVAKDVLEETRDLACFKYDICIDDPDEETDPRDPLYHEDLCSFHCHENDNDVYDYRLCIASTGWKCRHCGNDHCYCFL